MFNTSLRIFLIAIAAIGFSASAAPAKKASPSAEELLNQARKAFYAYQFDVALDLLDKYESNITSGKKPGQPAAEYHDLLRRADLGSTMLGRVEKIAIIDSIAVDSATFIQAYRLSAPTGYLTTAETLPEGFSGAHPTTVFVTENGDKMLWGAPADDAITLVGSSLLADGSWEAPHSLGSAVNAEGNANYPFLMSDGTTLYYAADGENSLGGYDIFITRNDGEEFLQPQNMGMPYNSPYNDFMLAIDELTGAGWWATDRNHIPGKLTVYVFVPQELRKSYPADDDNIADRAFITDIAATHEPGVDYSRILKAIDAINHTDSSSTADFTFAMPGGQVYTSLADFKSSKAAAAMETYLETRDDLQQLTERLADYRRQYRDGNKSLSAEILKSENELKQMRQRLQRIANNVVQLETSR